MTRAHDTDTSPTPPRLHDGLPRPDVAADVADSLSDVLRAARQARARLMAASSDVVEPATELLLRLVAADGPVRASALAVSVQSDLSTVSRHVAALVADGLIERRADPVDGRACLLAVTENGRAALSERDHMRRKFYSEVLRGWDEGELDEFARLLARFAHSYKTVQAIWLADRIGGEPSSFAASGDEQ